MAPAMTARVAVDSALTIRAVSIASTRVRVVSPNSPPFSATAMRRPRSVPVASRMRMRATSGDETFRVARYAGQVHERPEHDRPENGREDEPARAHSLHVFALNHRPQLTPFHDFLSSRARRIGSSSRRHQVDTRQLEPLKPSRTSDARNPPPQHRPRHLHLVPVLRQRPRIVHGPLRQRRNVVLGQPSDRDVLLHRLRHPPRLRRNPTQHEPNPSVLSPHRCQRHQREIPRRALHHLLEPLHSTRRATRDLDRAHVLPGAQDRLVVQSLTRQHVEVRDRHAPNARRPANLHLRLQRRQRHRGVRGVHDVARPAAEDRVVLVFPRRRRAAVAPILVAGKPAPEIPAPRPLTKIAGNRPHGAEGRCPDALAGLREGAEPVADQRLARQVGEARRSADPHPSVRTLGHALCVRDARQVDERLGTGEVLANAYHEVRATSQRGGTGSGKLLVRVFARRCATVRKLVYHQRERDGAGTGD